MVQLWQILKQQILPSVFLARKSKKGSLFWYKGLVFSLILILGFVNCSSALADTSVNSAASSSIQPYLNRVMEQVSEFRLDNGMKFIVLENHEAPVVSFVTYANVGGVDEPDGKTGVAHFLEHLAFKGTDKIGTREYSVEKKYLERLDRLSSKIQQAKAEGNQEKLTQLTKEFAQTEAVASNLVEQNEYGKIVETAGGVGLNAVTSTDYTSYFYSFPANKLELWMSLESERFLDPVFREFYKEKQVILEERRLRTDNSAIGTMIEAFLDTAFTEHPYKRPVIGYDEDIRNLTRDDVEEFFATYYAPNNLTVAIVGDVKPKEVKNLAKLYFGRYQAKPAPAAVTKTEPAQQETRTITVEFPSQPWYLEGYHIPGINEPDYPVYEVISQLLSNGRTSRLYQSLVEKQQVALSAQGYNGFPGNKYPNLMLFYALTAPGHSVEDVETALQKEIDKLKNQPVTRTELKRVKTQLKATLLRSLDSNMGMARILTEYEAKTGDWRNVFTELEEIAQVMPADIQRVARKTFTTRNRTIGKLLPKSS
ncbi:MAG: pitrilysin family protein [Xenococcaceae cyanobacterium MO_188.B29]|nr:pitrilysin family protein [Xenococcaceae cyanobacterium MO_188.B29]